MANAPLDDAIVALLATNDFTALAALVQNPAIATRLRMQSLGKLQGKQRKIQARASLLLFRTQLGETDKEFLKLCIREIHFGGHGKGATAADKVVEGAMDGPWLAEAAELAKWICESPTRRVAHLKRLRAVRDFVATIAPKKLDAAPKKRDEVATGLSD